MKNILRIPTKEQYAYIETEFEGTPDEAVVEYLRLTSLVQGGAGVGMKALAQIIYEYCTTGAIVNGGEYDFSLNEKTLLGEIKKIVRNNK